MTAPPDATIVRDFLERARRRVTLVASVEGAAAGLAAVVLATIVAVLFRRLSLGPVVVVGTIVVVGLGIARVFERRSRAPGVATLVERRAPKCRNLLITADELMNVKSDVAVAGVGDEYVIGIVLREAARLVGTLNPQTLFPARNALIALLAGAALWATTLAFGQRASESAVAAPRGGGSGALAPTVSSVDVVVTPPAYSGQQTRALHDPVRIEALAGSQLRLTIHARATSILIETLKGRDSLTSSQSETFSRSLPADADGYVAIEPRSNGHAGNRKLIGLSVFPDAAPRARITAPGKDLFLRDAHQPIDVAVEADDDIGIASLRLHYTKVSGSGERFTFVEGDVPITIMRASERNWTARVHWSLEGLGLTPGDMIVYRALVTDHRPGSAPTESDSFIAEIIAPGGVAAPGFAVDPDQERYAVSQQMVILKTERLQAQRSAMSTEDFANASAEIAVEQRKVRAEFVFMMGGEIADAPDPNAAITDLNEESEAEGEADLSAGRMQNQGRVALLRAIRAMSRAATSLTVSDLPPALTHERAALAGLEQAFSRSRILLRALTEHEKLDLSRRLTGSLSEVTRDVHPTVEPEANARADELRKALSSIATVASRAAFTTDAPATLSSAAANVLRVDPSNKALQDVAASLSSAMTAIDRRHSGDAHRDLERAVTGLASVLRAGLPDAPSIEAGLEAGRLSGALSDALRARVPQ